jgi:hypothetical protein
MDKFFSAIGHFFKHLAVVVSDAFVTIFGQDIAHTFAVGAESILNSDIGKIALTAVQEVQALAAGVDKKAAAFSKIADAAKSAGIDASESIINMLIEIAVQKVKGQFGPATAA